MSEHAFISHLTYFFSNKIIVYLNQKKKKFLVKIVKMKLLLKGKFDYFKQLMGSSLMGIYLEEVYQLCIFFLLLNHINITYHNKINLK